MQRYLLLPALLAAAALATAPSHAQAAQAAPAAKDPKAAQDVSGKKAVNAGDDVSHVLKDITLKTATGESFSFAEWFKGKDAKDAKDANKLYVLTFWSMECPWVKMWNPDLAQLYSDYSSKGVQFVGIDSNVEEVKDGSKLAKAAKDQKIVFPVLLDDGNRLADAFGAQTTPQVYLVNGKGKVIYTGSIDNDAKDEMKGAERKDYLKDAIDAGLAGKDPAVASSKPAGCSIKRGKPQP